MHYQLLNLHSRADEIQFILEEPCDSLDGQPFRSPLFFKLLHFDENLWITLNLLHNSRDIGLVNAEFLCNILLLLLFDDGSEANLGNLFI